MRGKWTTLACVSLLVAGVAGCARDEAGRSADPAPADGAAAAACEHGIADAGCPFCHPDLIETLGMCKGHGVPEAYCYQCNPALIPAFQATGDWCAGHDRPESQCSLCNPELAPASPGADSGAPARPSLELGRETRDIPRSQRPPSVACSTEEMVVRLDSAEIARYAGLELVTAEQETITQTLECNARIQYDGDRHAHLSSQVPGTVAAIHHGPGDRVESGEVLLTIASSELGSAKAAYLQSLVEVELWTKHHARESELLRQEAATERDVLEAETALAQSRIGTSRAEQELLRLGLSPARIRKVAETGDTSPAYSLTAPFAGTVVERTAGLGEVVDPGRPLFAIADVTTMWALLDVFETDIPEVAPGQAVVLQIPGLPGQPVAGHIDWVAAQVDPRTRTLQARARLRNPDGALKANMFAVASVAVRDRHPAVVVPVDAVQWEGCCNVVFVRQSDTLYEPRKVFLGVNTGTHYEVLRGLQPGEQIVGQGAFLLKTEILKGSIGAGCCEVDPGA